MKQTRTEKIGTRTGKFSRTAIAEKDPNFDYCFKRKADVESGLVGQEGWEVARDSSWFTPYQKQAKTKGRAQLALGDTVLCKRSTEASEYFNDYINEKRKAQIRLIKSAATDARQSLKQTGYSFKVTDNIKTNFTQKIGPNLEAANG